MRTPPAEEYERLAVTDRTDIGNPPIFAAVGQF